MPIILPVPELVLEAERKEKKRKEKVLSQLKQNGVQIEKLPQEEIEAGDGEVIRACSKWNGHLESKRRNGKDCRVKELEELLAALQKWRSETAILQCVAPGGVLAEQTLLNLACATATLPPAMSMNEEDLNAVGVRTAGIKSLIELLAEWSNKCGRAKEVAVAGKQSLMQFTPGQAVDGNGPWKHAVYKPNKRTGLAAWESSYNRFMKGESPKTIAMTQASGKPIQVRTVCNHILQAIIQGRGVDLHRLATFSNPPTGEEWEQFQAAEISQGIDVVEEDKASMKELLRPILGDAFIDAPYDERSQEEQTKLGTWYERVNWYMVLRRIGYKPTFSSE